MATFEAFDVKTNSSADAPDFIVPVVKDMVPEMMALMHRISKHKALKNDLSTSAVLQLTTICLGVCFSQVCRTAGEHPPPDGWQPNIKEFEEYAKLLLTNVRVNGFGEDLGQVGLMETQGNA